jgi:hypothetical protein
VAGRRAARRLVERANVRKLDGAEEKDPAGRDGASPAVEPSPGPESTGIASQEPAAPRPPLDLEGSRRRLEERQANWISFREEWLRARAGRRRAEEPGSSTEPRGAPPES